ncbi:MAG: hypothetical protein KBF94_17435, partial [Ilumatobacteraceae bacterium]|nr:hypothetical protein [Ilumatobacteraceae bacterium]
VAASATRAAAALAMMDFTMPPELALTSAIRTVQVQGYFGQRASAEPRIFRLPGRGIRVAGMVTERVRGTAFA